MTVPIDGYARYAVFWAPPKGSALAKIGAAWLGWDAEARAAPPRQRLDLPDGIAAETITAAPRRYGLHATLKPPIRLAEGLTPDDLDGALADLARTRAAIDAPGLTLGDSLGFVSLRPAKASTALDALAAACVTTLDHFRAPAPAEETARRRAAGLTERQERHLTVWGYPYVLEEFRFHVTLSSRLAPDAAQAVVAALTPHFAPSLGPGLSVSEICLFGDPGDGAPAHLLRRYALTG
ncbi:MAG: DUF1045 domain-containing protein [Pseudomonadota bacterium]